MALSRSVVLTAIAGLLAVAAAVSGGITILPRIAADRIPSAVQRGDEGGEGFEGLTPSVDGVGCAECHDRRTAGPAPHRPAPLPRAALQAILRSL